MIQMLTSEEQRSPTGTIREGPNKRKAIVNFLPFPDIVTDNAKDKTRADRLHHWASPVFAPTSLGTYPLVVFSSFNTFLLPVKPMI